MYYMSINIVTEHGVCRNTRLGIQIVIPMHIMPITMIETGNFNNGGITGEGAISKDTCCVA